MREITQPMRLFDFVFGPLVLPLQDLDAREGELFLTTASVATTVPPRRIQQSGVAAWMAADCRDERT